MSIPLIAVVGPTASGKTGLGIYLANRLNGEVVSADSMQIYKGMNIATAKPDESEKNGIVHHLMDFLEATETFSVAQYVEMAHKVISDIHCRNKMPILVGGTGLYVKSLLSNINFSTSSSNDNIRRELQLKLEAKGINSLLQELSAYDKESAERLSKERNPKRIIRALEIYLASGITMTEHLRASKEIPSPYNAVKIGLTCKDREKLYSRINQRVDIMVKNGLLEEAEKYRNQSISETAAKAIGYKELEPYFTGEKTLQEALEKLKMETRRYAKRQLTWFKRDAEINWIYTDECESKKEVFEKAMKIIKENNIIIKGDLYV